MTMDEESGKLEVLIDGDQALVLGASADVEQFFERLETPRTSSSEVKQGILSAAAIVLGLAATSENMGGRYFKITEESFRALQQNAEFNPLRKGLFAGTIRQSKGQIQSHANFTQVTGLNPIAMSNVATLTATLALKAAVTRLEDLVESMDVKLDQLLQDNRSKAMGDVQGVSQVLSKSYDQFQSSGHVSQTSWDQVAGQATIVAQSRAHAENQLRQVIFNVSATGLKDRADGLNRVAGTELKTWLAILATCNVNEARLEAIEAAHARDESPEASLAHGKSISESRDARLLAVSSKLRSLNAALIKAGTVSDFDRVRSPHTTSSIREQVNSCLSITKIFAEIHNIQDAQTNLFDRESWRRSVANVAGSIKNTAEQTARGLPKAIQDKSDERIIRKADAIQERRQQSSEASAASSSTPEEAEPEAVEDVPDGMKSPTT